MTVYNTVKAEDYICITFRTFDTDPELSAIHSKLEKDRFLDKLDKGVKERLQKELFEKFIAKIRDKCKVGDIVYWNSRYFGYSSDTSEITELLCDYSKAIVINTTGDWWGSCVLAPQREIRALK